MTKRTKCLALSILMLQFSFAEHSRSQESDSGPGFLNIVNLISLREPTYLSVEDFQLYEGTPSLPGSESGFIAIKPGEYSFRASNESADPSSEEIPISIESGKNLIVICFDHTEELNDGTLRSSIRLNLLAESLNENLPRLSVVSLLNSEQVTGRVSGNQVIFHQRRALIREVELNEIVPIVVGEEEVEEVDIAKNAHYMVFLFHDPETSKVATSVIANSEFEFQDNLEAPEEEE